MGISIDGFVCRPDGAHDWGTPPEDDALREHKVALLRSVGALSECGHQAIQSVLRH